MNRRYPESASGNGGRERSGSPDDYYGSEERQSRSSRAPREEDISRWTSEGGSQTYYRRDDEDQRGPQQYGGGYGSRHFNQGASHGPSNPYGEPYGFGQGRYGYGAQQTSAGANPHQFGGQHGGFYNYEKKEYIDQDTGALTQVIRTEYKNQKNSVDTGDQKKLILLSTNELPVVKHVQHEQTKAKAGFHIQNENFDFDMDNNLQKAARALPRRAA